ncbi:DUF5722 domain-containing protein [Butyrivibrio fibrisolvens]|uniref:DUF5722 domain-containing protein n=1 Tax=Pseudobutyrivibrio ruminis TaxID=46206 RepID=UPI0004101E3D|nr:DUF5722 domain-containing protein [Pseudobutyrivibrio ruminis]MDC7278772.1 DUF5722 domain-containing protein [Butyrivibrio fibrisolvens]
MCGFKKFSSIVMAIALVLCGVLSFNVSVAKAEGAVAINSVTIQGGAVVITTSGSAASEDGMYHLIASAACQVAPAGDEVAQQAVGATVFSIPLNKGQANSVLYKKFTICVLAGGKLAPVSNSMYILNPEACATVYPARMDNGIKGIFPEVHSAIADLNQVVPLGIKQVNLNVPISKVATLGVYDKLVMKYNSLGIQVNMILLADKAAGKDYISPLSFKGGRKDTVFYAFNASSPEALERIGNAATIIASRYSNVGFGQVDNFIIGNEVNAYPLWNYVKVGSNAEFVNEYYKAFRVMYNAIKATNGTANVYTCIDHQWAVPEASYYMSGRDFLVQFNRAVSAEGNIDWKIAAHPNNYWLLATKSWETSNKVTHSQSTPYVTMANLEVLTDFLTLPEMLNPKGEVRNVKIAELGYSSHKGEADQAASIVFAYLVASNNRYVDGLVIMREADNRTEINQGLWFGLCKENGTPKTSFSYYQNPTDPVVVAQASAHAGVDLYSLVVPR